MAAENSKCIICRNHLKGMKTNSDPESLQEWQFYCWKNECAKSVCEVLLGCDSLSFIQYFQRGEYCPSCLQTLRDVHFTWRQLKCFENKINELTDVLQNKLEKNYEKVKKKTESAIVEERTSTVLNISQENVNFLNNYSYNEIVEMIFTVSSKLTKNSICHTFPLTATKENTTLFTEGLEKPYSKIKIESEEIEIQEEIKIEEGNNAFVEFNDLTGSERIQHKVTSSNPSVVEHKRKSLGVTTFNDSNEQNSETGATGAIDWSDVDNNLSNDNESSDCDSLSYDSWTPESSQRARLNVLPRRLSLKRSAKSDEGEAGAKITISISKRVKSQKKKPSKLKKGNHKPKISKPIPEPYECPICHKIVSQRGRIGHERTHTGEKPFQCEDCGRSFNEKGGLSDHRKVRHGKLDPLGRKIKNAANAAKAENECASRKRRYHCDLCSWTFNYVFRYLRHLKDSHLNTHIKDGDTFNFHYCDAENCLHSFTSQSSLRDHIIGAHCSGTTKDEEKVVLECNVCNRIFVQQNNLEDHKKSHKENHFGCDYCHLTFSSQSEMEYHKPRHEIKFQLSDYCHLCEECGEGFKDIGQLKKHVAKLHIAAHPKVSRKSNFNTTIRKRLTCKVCNKPMYNTGGMTLENHMYTHTHPNGFKCSKCPEIRRTPKDLEKHEKKHNPNPNTTQNGNRKTKKLAVNTCIENGNTSETKTVCEICQEEVGNIESHMKLHDGFQCSYCDKKEKSLRLLQFHIRRCHYACDPNLPDLFKIESNRCDACNKDCVTKQLYRKHLIRYHYEEFKSTHPYFCNICWMVFYTEEGRNSHTKDNHERFKCTFEGCDKVFAYTKPLILHLNVHYKRKPFLCSYCKKGFAQDTNCISHIYMVHMKHRPFRCKLCVDNEGYYVRKDFHKHVDKCHPEILPENYSTVLDYRKPATPALVERSAILDAPDYPPLTRRPNKPKIPPKEYMQL